MIGMVDESDLPTPMDKALAAKVLSTRSIPAGFGGGQPAPHPATIRSDPRILAHYREHTLKMIQELANIAYDLNNSPGVRLAAISEYLTRAMGKPVQAVDLNLTDNRPIVIDGALSKLAEIATPVDNVDKSG